MTKWSEWCNTWYYIGWHEVATRSNFGVAVLLQIATGLLCRVRRLEMREPPNLFGGLV